MCLYLKGLVTFTVIEKERALFRPQQQSVHLVLAMKSLFIAYKQKSSYSPQTFHSVAK